MCAMTSAKQKFEETWFEYYCRPNSKKFCNPVLQEVLKNMFPADGFFHKLNRFNNEHLPSWDMFYKITLSQLIFLTCWDLIALQFLKDDNR